MALKKKALATVAALTKKRDAAQVVYDKLYSKEPGYYQNVDKKVDAFQKKLEVAYQKKIDAWDKQVQAAEKVVKNFNDQIAQVGMAAFAPPAKGKFIAYKKVYSSSATYNSGDRHYTSMRTEIVAKLEIPASADRLIGTDEGPQNRKCRASEAKVLGFFTLKNKPYKQPKTHTVFAGHDVSFEYKKGATVKPQKPFAKKKDVCASGIHFFMTFEDAAQW